LAWDLYSVKDLYDLKRQLSHMINEENALKEAIRLCEKQKGGKGKDGVKVKGEAKKRCGGSHRNMKKPVGDKLDSHHAPDRNADPKVSVNDGSAIKMDPKDHKETSSYGRKGKTYREETARMIAEGRHRDAMAREVRDIRNAAYKVSGNRKKYNRCIKEMLEYAKRMGHLPPKK